MTLTFSHVFADIKFVGFAGTEYEQMEMGCVLHVERLVYCVYAKPDIESTRKIGAKYLIEKLWFSNYSEKLFV